MLTPSLMQDALARNLPLNDMARDILETIDEFGWMVLTVGGDAGTPSISYTIGAVRQTEGLLLGELALIGIDTEPAQAILNHAVARTLAGTPLTVPGFDDQLLGGRRSFVGQVRAEFLVPGWFGGASGSTAHSKRGRSRPVRSSGQTIVTSFPGTIR